MLERQKEIFYESIIEPCKKNLTAVLFFVGLFFIVIGSLFGTHVDEITRVKGIGDVILKIGSATLGAGVFAVIMQTSQFINVFQRHIADVFFNPENFNDMEQLTNRWLIITNSILKNVLPSSHDRAAEQIKSQFFNSEIQYHFKNYESIYEIEIKDDRIEILNTCITNLIISPNQDEPILKQDFSTKCEDCCISLIKLFIDGEEQKTDGFLEDTTDNKRKILHVPLRKFNKKNIKFERTIKMIQNLKEEPYIMGTISRYITGASIKAKVINPEFKLVFKKHGLTQINEQPIEDGQGYLRWQLAHGNELLLPGQGYTIFILPR